MKKIIIIITCFIGLSGAFAQQRGMFHNPVIEADVPDPSMIRVGNYYYLVSTTMHLMPGCPVMRSKDLVHWETISYVFQRLTDLPRYDLKEGTVYGRGQWASSLRYHDGRFYVWFSPNDEPHRGYIYTAEDPAGEWTLLSRPPHHHDASLFFDDDGKVYLFYGTGQLRQLKSDLSDVEPGGIDQKIFERDADEQGLLEGSQAFKHNGRYYVMMISMDWSIPGRLRREVCYRADQITGPYEKKVILETEFQGYGGVGQGCIVDTPDGNWYGFIFQDRGGIGRVPTLMPCRWEDGWPILGDADGRVPECMEMPVYGEECKGSIMGSDGFDTDQLSLNWQWNHNPLDDCWSLTGASGFPAVEDRKGGGQSVSGSQYLDSAYERTEVQRCGSYGYLEDERRRCCGLLRFQWVVRGTGCGHGEREKAVGDVTSVCQSFGPGKKGDCCGSTGEGTHGL